MSGDQTKFSIPSHVMRLSEEIEGMRKEISNLNQKLDAKKSALMSHKQVLRGGLLAIGGLRMDQMVLLTMEEMHSITKFWQPNYALSCQKGRITGAVISKGEIRVGVSPYAIAGDGCGTQGWFTLTEVIEKRKNYISNFGGRKR